MSFPEGHDDLPLFEVPNDAAECVRRVEQHKLATHDEFVAALGHVAALGQDTWPQSIHQKPLSDGELVVWTRQTVAGAAGASLHLTFNQFCKNGSERHVDIMDFIVPMSAHTVAYKRTRADYDNAANKWPQIKGNGPILQPTSSQLFVTIGEYDLPRSTPIFPTRRQTQIMLDMHQTRLKQHLTQLLGELSEVTYELEKSHYLK